MLLQRGAGSKFGRIEIPATSSLVIGENATAGVHLEATGIHVLGALRAGSATCRLGTRMTITLHGSRPSTRADLDALSFSTKGIHVSGSGALELHGRLYHRTWARLARSVQPGDTSVRLQRAVNWEAGQEVVLTTTAIKDARDFHRNEVLTLARDANGSDELELTSAASYLHEAHGAWQGEVGLLSRTIVVQGSADDSEPTDVSPLACTHDTWTLGSYSVPCPNHLTGFGAHVVASGESAVLRLSSVELRRVGQTNVLGRYPVHFHLMGDVSAADGTSSLPRAYVRFSSIHRSFYRCVSVHGTSHALVSENVAYDAIGHCYYLEDGVEEHNTLAYNLAAHVHFIGAPARASGQHCEDVDESDDLRLPADVAAAGFYITNGRNYVVGNAASGGWAGFALPELPAPVRSCRGERTVPSAKDVLRFEGNTAHSAGWWWTSAGQICSGPAAQRARALARRCSDARAFDLSSARCGRQAVAPDGGERSAPVQSVPLRAGARGPHAAQRDQGLPGAGRGRPALGPPPRAGRLRGARPRARGECPRGGLDRPHALIAP